MNKLTILLSITGLFFSSCGKQKYGDADTFTFSDIPEKISLKGEIIELEDMLKPSKLYIKDTVLFTVNSNQEYFVTAYSLNSLKKTGDHLPFGSGPNEIHSLNTIQFTDSLMWGYNGMERYVFRYDFTRSLMEKTSLDDAFDKAVVVGNEFYTYSIARPEVRFSVYDRQGKFVRNVGAIPDAGMDLTSLEMYESFFCNMVLNSEDKSVFVAYMNTDLIEIYANDTLKARKHGPEQFFPVRKEETNAEGMTRVRFVKGKTKDAYFSPVALDNEVWVIYSGKTFDPSVNDSFLNNTVIVFDWNGNPLRQYTTDIPFYSLAIDRRNRAIYGIAMNPEFTLVRFNY